MRILIAGAGAVGTSLAKQLSQEGHDVAIVERRADVAAKLSERLDVLAVTGNCTSPEVLESAGIDSCQMVIAVTDVDEVNMIVCLLAAQYDVEKKIARIRNPEIAGEKGKISLADLHVDQAINPDEITVEKIVRLTEIPGTLEVAEFADGKVEMRGFEVPPHAQIAGRCIRDLRPSPDRPFPLVVALARGDGMIIPEGKDEIHVGDKIYVVGEGESIARFARRLNPHVEPADKVVIYGTGPTAVAVAEALESRIGKIVLIEPDAQAAEAAARQLDETLVLHGEATDMDILTEAGVGAADFFLALSHDDQSNFLAALLARKLGVREDIILCNEADYVPVLQSIGMDIVINPRLITAGVILQAIRRGHVLSVVKLAGTEAEVIELVAEMHNNDEVIGRALHERIFPKGAILGAIIRDGAWIVPDGESVLLPGDRLVIFSLPEATREVERLFSPDS
ncbi:MAG: Trk system potassium transporter TrkA [Planctomycetes bacterium]|nr:Trk system potassium transporter TrkA [Planctomycetota bacterium]